LNLSQFMKRLFFIAIAFFCISSFSQTTDPITPKEAPLWLVDGQIIDQSLIKSIKDIYINEMTVLKEKEAVALYGKEAQSGAISVTIKNDFKNEFKKIKRKHDQRKQNNTYQKAKLITGIVTDCEDIPLDNVAISNLNTKEISHSDSEGKYIIKIRKNDVLMFSKSLFNSEKVKVNMKSKIDIKLKINQNTEKNRTDEPMIMIKKPVIYLYPTQKTEVTFKLDFNGKLLATFPKYATNWEVVAYPDGKIFDKKTNRFYTSLFWDGENIFPKEHYRYKDGFTILKDNLIPFLTQKLEYMGLNTFETNDFVQYWLPLLEKNEINFIHFWVNADYDIISKNSVSPKPDTAIRIYMEFYGTNKKIDIREQQLPQKERKGFTLIEWGGADVSDAINSLQTITN
jgi:hypothetical protein